MIEKNRTTAQLLEQACLADDDAAVSRLGWGRVYDVLRLGWPKAFPLADFAIYCRMLTGKDPAKVEETIIEIAARSPKWRASPAEILGGLTILDPPPSRPPGSGPRPAMLRPDQTPQAHQAVLDAVAAGELACECIPRPANVNVDELNVLRCPECDGLELGQYEAAIEETAP